MPTGPEIPPALEDELSDEPALLDRLRPVWGQPRELIEALRNDIGLLVAVARADTRPHLVRWFSDLDIDRAKEGWSHDPERTGPIGPLAAGVEWTWRGRHNKVLPDNLVPEEPLELPFNGIAPSDREVTVHGVSLMGVEDDQFMVRRYVDWVGVYAQLGLTLNWRTPVSSEP
jgi:hypothetical protein